MSKRLNTLEKEIEEIRKRNQSVELDKKWETSYTRRFLLIFFTYFALGAYMSAIHVDRPWLSAIVPTVGFWLSTLTLPIFKSIWTEVQTLVKQKTK